MANGTEAAPIKIEGEVMETSGSTALEAQTRGEVDIQVATARRYPRSLVTFKQTALQMATLDEETAEACIYALPRDGKTVEGPSARLAEILASAYGHMRVEGRVIEEDDSFVYAQGRAWDVQNNVAISFETRRRITDRNGRRYKDDMITVTANAATSIALRNAILKVVPKAFWGPIYDRCREVAVGKAETLVDRRAKMLAHFQKMGVTPERVFALLGVKGVEDITLDNMATLKGLATAIKEGDTSVDQAFPIEPPRPAERKSQQQQQAPQQPAPTEKPAETLPVTASSPASPAPPAEPAKPTGPNVGTIALLVTQPGGTVVKLETGFQCATRNPELIAALGKAKDAGRKVMIETRAAKDPKHLPIIDEIHAV